MHTDTHTHQHRRSVASGQVATNEEERHDRPPVGRRHKPTRVTTHPLTHTPQTLTLSSEGRTSPPVRQVPPPVSQTVFLAANAEAVRAIRRRDATRVARMSVSFFVSWLGSAGAHDSRLGSRFSSTVSSTVSPSATRPCYWLRFGVGVKSWL